MIDARDASCRPYDYDMTVSLALSPVRLDNGRSIDIVSGCCNLCDHITLPDMIAVQ